MYFMLSCVRIIVKAIIYDMVWHHEVAPVLGPSMGGHMVHRRLHGLWWSVDTWVTSHVGIDKDLVNKIFNVPEL